MCFIYSKLIIVKCRAQCREVYLIYNHHRHVVIKYSHNQNVCKHSVRMINSI